MRYLAFAFVFVLACEKKPELKECTCSAAPIESCQPNCPPIKWQSADCESANGRPRACKEPATH